MKEIEVRPTPIRTAGTATFFDRAKMGELMLQHCQNCQKFNLCGHHYCPACLSANSWKHSEGLGQIVSFSIVRESSHAGFKELRPYAVAEVSLSEGPMLKLRVIGSTPDKIFIGQQARMDFLHDEHGEATPVWRVV